MSGGYADRHPGAEAGASNGFADSLDHLLAELSRIHALLRARVAGTPREERDEGGLPGLCISARELDAFLADAPDESNVARSETVAEDAMGVREQCGLAADIARRREASLQRGVALRLHHLGCVFSLTTFDIDALLLCLAAEIDVRYERVYAYLHDDLTRKAPSVGLALDLLCRTFRERLTAYARFVDEAPLLRHRLVSIFDDAAQPMAPLLRRPLKLDERVVGYLLGSDNPDARIARYCTRVLPQQELEDLILPDETRSRLLQLCQPEALPANGVLFYFHGMPGSGKQSTAEALCKRLGLGLLRVELSRLLRLPEAEFGQALELLQREAALIEAVLYWDGLPAVPTDDQLRQRDLLVEALEKGCGLAFLAGQVAWEPSDALKQKTVVSAAFGPPDPAERCMLWERALSPDIPLTKTEIGILASRFRLSGGQIRDAARSARTRAYWRDPFGHVVEPADLQAACRDHSNQRLTGIAEKIAPRYGWDDIVLPPDQRLQLTDICNAAKYGARVYGDWGFGEKLSRGKGLSVLFSGPSGTGKTMAAEIVAGALGMDLYRIDLSLVVSKFIGETEKNLARIFAEAETANAILFFDEADALFGKRSEVRDAHDRYANIETSYLLQRMEAFEGVAILATNLGKNLDQAFLRRLHFIMDFPLPDAGHRREIWERIFPTQMPRARDLDLDFMANRFELAGGNIKNVALAAAFKAAANGGVVGLGELLRATEREYQKMGKLILNGEFEPAEARRE